MGVRGRKSAASQQTVVVGNFGERPEPPGGLTKEQADIWRVTVASEASEFFKTAATRSMLVEYCRHTATSAVLARQIEAFDVRLLADEDGLRRYDKLLAMRDRESKASSSKATKLRLTNQARYVHNTASTLAKNAGGSQRPWEFGKASNA